MAGEVHHTPADAINPLSRDNGPAIWMEKADHRKTASCGWSAESKAHQAAQRKLVSEGKFREAIQMDINDIHALFGNKYDKNINEMLKYVDELDKAGKLPKATTLQK